MTDEEVDTGFDAVYAGEKWEEAPPVTAAVTIHEALPVEPHVCASTTGNRCDICFGPVGLTEEGKQAAKALVGLPGIDWPSLAQLAREIAMDIKERHVVLADHKLTEAQYEYLETYNEFYIAALKAACIEWHAPLSTQERIKLEAAAILEDSLPGLGSRMQNTREQLPGVIEAAKLFAKVAGVGERDAGTAAPGERFTINIDLGGDQKVVVQSGPAPQALAQPAGREAISTDPER
jgi:hypothetical protein